MPETDDTGKHDDSTKTKNEEIYDKEEKEDKHSDEDDKDDKDEKEGKDKKKKKKDKDEKDDKKKDKKEKNPNDEKDLKKLKLKVEKIGAKMHDLEDQREVILELFNEAGKIAANANAARLPFDPLSSHLTKKKKKAK